MFIVIELTGHIECRVFVMVFLLYFLIPVSFINIALALFFPFPAPLFGIGLQAIFFLLSLVIFISRLSKGKGLIRSVLITGIHGAVLFFTINLYVKVVIPNQEEGEVSAFKTGVTGIKNMVFGKTSEAETNNTPENVIPDDPGFTDKEKVEDPF